MVSRPQWKLIGTSVKLDWSYSPFKNLCEYLKVITLLNAFVAVFLSDIIPLVNTYGVSNRVSSNPSVSLIEYVNESPTLTLSILNFPFIFIGVPTLRVRISSIPRSGNVISNNSSLLRLASTDISVSYTHLTLPTICSV